VRFPLSLLLKQIVRSDGTAIGKLLYKTEPVTSTGQPQYDSSPTSSGVSHWMVSFEGSDLSEEDVSERMLGCVMNSSAAESDTSTVAIQASEESSASAMAVAPKKIFAVHSMKKKTKTAPKARKATTAQQKQVQLPRRVHTTRAAARTAGASVELFSGIEEISLPPKPKKPASSSSSSRNGGMVKVQMLTGTLFIYRDGPKRHVKFVRTK
jgi:cytoskeletal protein RodZ